MSTSNPAPREPRERRAPGLAEARKAVLALRQRRPDVGGAVPGRIAPAPRDRRLPLSYAQQRLWFLDRWADGRPVYNAPLVLRLRAALDVAALRRALDDLVARHEVLRTRYPAENGVPHQVVEPPAPVPLPVHDLSGRADPEAAARDLVHELVRAPFDLAGGPVLRPALITLDAAEHVLVLAMHHIATDGWSTGILVAELVAGYRRAAVGSAPAEPLPVQFADYAAWQRGWLAGEDPQEQSRYWREQLRDLPTLDLPTDRPRPVRPTLAGAIEEALLPESLARRLTDVARDERVTALAVALAAFTAVVSRYSGQSDVVVGSVFSGRTRPEVEPLIGFFANTLVLRTSTAGNPTFRELLARTNRTVVDAHLNQDLPFGRLVDELAPARDPGRNPLFQVSFTLQHTGAESAALGDLEAEVYPVEVGTARFDLAVQVTPVPGRGLRLWAEYSTELFDAARVRRLFAHYRRALEAFLADPDLRLGQLDLLGDDEHALVDATNRTECDLGVGERCLHHLFEAVADRLPTAVASRFEGASLTYRELDGLANRVAHRLVDAGVGPESVVGVLLERGPGLPTAFLGVLKAGGAYLPLDPDHPPARRALVLADAGAATVVTTRALARELPDGVRAVCLDDPEADDAPATRPEVAVSPDNLAYVIFTSGSTGRPKGVQVQHRSIANFTPAVIALFGLDEGDRVLQFANPSFDVSLFDFFGALCSGATLVQAPRSELLDPERLTALMRSERVTVTDLPPAVLRSLSPDDLPDLRALFVGLEAFPGELVNAWNTPGRQFHNGYGPTEATVACIDHLCAHVHHDAMPPIGLPMANYRAHVVDRFGQPVPVGVPGELLVGGVGVARGYAGRPGLTAERFVPDPYGGPGERLYRTGDLVRRREDGALEFVGRVDDQVKIRGLRVEPAEVEHAVLALDGVRDAAVVVAGSGTDARLVAYVAGDSPDPHALRAALGEALPTYLVPSEFVVLPELPRAASGKLDRAALPAPGGSVAVAVAEPPTTATQIALADIWREVLGVAEPTLRDGFFAIGGTSLKITKVAARVEEVFGVRLELRELFLHSTLAELAELVEERELADVPADDLAELLDAVDRDGGLPR
ncbi:amino acid adenylation domain-containing protein [Saccharothrix longispora]|uniref:Amino acid adenylation domain-containing protein n=1 Tax=Saccharothrix longispora TaxID=33920 RepID=A0ABU1PTL6_9PSEU|nr:amino acid adenylation domain-containing protein [Saccharothrix longispora]MDR6593988.1 amino acid adenylation domain-containing protein [Saccharothrix longispora]